MYKELFNEYNGVEIGDHSDKGYIFSMFAYACQCIALNDFIGLCDCGSEIKKIFKLNTVNVDCCFGSNNISGYVFRPIFNFDGLLEVYKYIEESYQCSKVGCIYTYVDSHKISLEYLKKTGSNNSNIYAITSLVRDANNRYNFKSYIYNNKNNYVYDFSNNIRMNKEQFDELNVVKELSALNYDEYLKQINECDLDKEGFSDLLYLGLVSLKEMDILKKIIK